MSGPPLRWLLMASHVPPGGSLGGIVRYTVELARALGEREDVELHLSARPEAAASLEHLVRHPGHLHALPAVPARLQPLLDHLGPPPRTPRGAGFDVVHGAKHLLPARTPGHRAPPARVLTVHDTIVLDRPGDFGRAKRHLLRRPYLASLRSADVPVCVSAATRERLRAWVPAAAARAAVTPLASSPALLGAPPRPVPQLEGRAFALVVGDPTARKNVPLVVRAWAEVVRSRPDAVLALVGPPSWGVSSYGPEAVGLEAAGQLVRLTAVPDAALRWAYEHAVVALCPSLAEGFGLPVVEALDLGAEVLVSADPALVEAAAGRALAVLAPDEPAAWAREVLAVLGRRGADGARLPGTHGPRPAAPGPRRTWADVADDTVAAVRAAVGRRAVS